MSESEFEPPTNAPPSTPIVPTYDTPAPDARPHHPTHPDVAVCEGDFYADGPEPTYAWMRANAPIYWDEKGSVWAISRYRDIKVISKDPETFSSAGGIRPDSGPLPMMIDYDDPEHWGRRKIVNRGFTPRRIRETEDKIREVCNEIIDTVIEKGECDFVRDIAMPLPMVMIGDMLGVEREDRDDLLRWSDDMLKAQSGSATEELFTEAATAYVEACTHLAAVIENRKAKPTDDLVSLLVHAEVDGDRLDQDALIHESLLILVGGDETTRHVVSEGMYQLLLHPDQRQMLMDEPAKIPTAVEEMLRWVTPIKNMARTITRDVVYGGQPMRAGQKLLLLYASANRDEEIFDNPQTFDIERTPNEHVAFGFGSHFCLGNSLARLEIRVMLEEVLRRMPDLELVSPAIPFRRANFIVGPESMPVTFSASR